MNLIGAIAAVTAFLSVWFGHVAVRKIESISPTIWLPATIFAILGLFVEFLSLSTASRPLSTVFGIFGMTLLIDAFELVRQQKRVMKGHAPANPANPRHAKILVEHPAATTLDLLKRDPIGKPVTLEQAAKLISDH
jgi:hypothetical protein